MKHLLLGLFTCTLLALAGCKPTTAPMKPAPQTPPPTPVLPPSSTPAATQISTPAQEVTVPAVKPPELPVESPAKPVAPTAPVELPAPWQLPPPPPIRVLGRTLYVSPDGQEKNDGLTPQTALPVQMSEELSQPGDVIYFTEGEYVTKNGKAILTISHSGEAEKPITYAPAPGANVVLRSMDAWDAIKVSSASHIVIQGFRVIGNSPNVTMEEAMREMSNLKNPRTCGNGIGITSNPQTKVPCSHIIVRNCEVSDLPGGGIFANHVDYLTFENNVVYRCAFWSPFGNSGLSVYQPTAIDDSTDTKIIIRNNVCFENYQNIPFFFSNRKDPSKRKVTDGNGIIIDDFLNTQDWGGGSGKEYTGRTLVMNNVTFANGGSGIHSYKSCNVDFIQNYAADNNRHPDLKDGQIFANSTKNVRILNNVLVAPPGKPVSSSFKNDGIVIDNNVYANLDGSTPKFQGDKGKNIIAVPGLKLVNWDKGGRVVEVTANSPLRSAGISLHEKEVDFFGIPRVPGKFDIGPFVLDSQAITTVSAEAQPVFASPAAGDLNEKITLEARGHGPVKETTKVQLIEGPEPGSSAIQVTIPEGTEGKKFRVNAKGEVAGAIAADQPVTLTFMARSSGSNRMLVLVHNTANPDRVKLMTDTQLTPEWKSYKVNGEKPEGFAAGEAIVEFMMGQAPGVIEISNVVLIQ